MEIITIKSFPIEDSQLDVIFDEDHIYIAIGNIRESQTDHYE